MNKGPSSVGIRRPWLSRAPLFQLAAFALGMTLAIPACGANARQVKSRVPPVYLKLPGASRSKAASSSRRRLTPTAKSAASGPSAATRLWRHLPKMRSANGDFCPRPTNPPSCWKSISPFELNDTGSAFRSLNSIYLLNGSARSAKIGCGGA